MMIRVDRSPHSSRPESNLGQASSVSQFVIACVGAGYHKRQEGEGEVRALEHVLKKVFCTQALWGDAGCCICLF